MKKFILVLLSLTLIFSLVSCKNLFKKDENTETEPEVIGCVSPIYYYDMQEFLISLGASQKDQSSSYYLRTYPTSVPLPISESIEFYSVSITTEAFNYSFVKKGEKKTFLSISVYKIGCNNESKPNMTFESIINNNLTLEAGAAYDARGIWYIDLTDTYASVNVYDNKDIDSLEEIYKYISFKKYTPENYNVGLYKKFDNVKNLHVYNELTKNEFVLSEAQQSNLFSIINSTNWKLFTKELTPSMTLSFWQSGMGDCELKYSAELGLFNDEVNNRHAYISEIERLYINSLLGIE